MNLIVVVVTVIIAVIIMDVAIVIEQVTLFLLEEEYLSLHLVFWLKNSASSATG